MVKNHKLAKAISEVSWYEFRTLLTFIRHAEPNYNNHNDKLRELSLKGMTDRKLVIEIWRILFKK